MCSGEDPLSVLIRTRDAVPLAVLSTFHPVGLVDEYVRFLTLKLLRRDHDALAGALALTAGGRSLALASAAAERVRAHVLDSAAHRRRLQVQSDAARRPGALRRHAGAVRRGLWGGAQSSVKLLSVKTLSPSVCLLTTVEDVKRSIEAS